MAELRVVESGGDLHGEPLRERLATEIKDSGLSQAKAAKEISISPAILNQLLAGKYDHNVEENETKINRWFKARQARREAERTLLLKEKFVQTNAAQRVTSGLVYAHTVRSISLIYGGAGLGKTHTAKYYVTNHQNVWLVTITPSARKPGAMLKRICRAAGTEPASIWPADVELQLQERLSGTGGLLVVDEANHLILESLDTLRAIQEGAGIGLALLGNERTYNQMTGGSRVAYFAQIWSRIGMRVHLAGAEEKDTNLLVDAWGADVAAQGRARLFSIAEREGYRVMLETLKNAVLAANGESVTGSHVEDAWKSLGGDA